MGKIRMTDSPAIIDTATRSPVKLEHTGRVGNWLAVQAKSLRGGLGGGELDKAVASIAATDG